MKEDSAGLETGTGERLEPDLPTSQNPSAETKQLNPEEHWRTTPEEKTPIKTLLDPTVVVSDNKQG